MLCVSSEPEVSARAAGRGVGSAGLAVGVEGDRGQDTSVGRVGQEARLPREAEAGTAGPVAEATQTHVAKCAGAGVGCSGTGPAAHRCGPSRPADAVSWELPVWGPSCDRRLVMPVFVGSISWQMSSDWEPTAGSRCCHSEHKGSETLRLCLGRLPLKSVTLGAVGCRAPCTRAACLQWAAGSGRCLCRLTLGLFPA